MRVSNRKLTKGISTTATAWAAAYKPNSSGPTHTQSTPTSPSPATRSRRCWSSTAHPPSWADRGAKTRVYQRLKLINRQACQENGTRPSMMASNSSSIADLSNHGKGSDSCNHLRARGAKCTNQSCSGVAKPILSRRSKIGIGHDAPHGGLENALGLTLLRIRYDSGKLKRNCAKSVVKNGTRLSTEKRIELRSAWRNKPGKP
ncbi:hypothetical protein GHT06_007325 [Daphnia sinensis]|uniref:Uncharacterized protein n=1 Tax=Daphnia sinensis TaxID=1820382 RepID=A0AAD5KTF7_9CRUS|nr:hypothetical protein GHT06_007325 [Daphnia sinensis]